MWIPPSKMKPFSACNYCGTSIATLKNKHRYFEKHKLIFFAVWYYIHKSILHLIAFWFVDSNPISVVFFFSTNILNIWQWNTVCHLKPKIYLYSITVGIIDQTFVASLKNFHSRIWLKLSQFYIRLKDFCKKEEWKTGNICF